MPFQREEIDQALLHGLLCDVEVSAPRRKKPWSGMRTIRLVVEYDGSGFHGLQFQPALRTVAGVLGEAVATLLRGPVNITAAGRTDAGVHATAQIASFATQSAFPLHKLAPALNALLPHDLAVREAEEMPAGFSARFSAQARHYRYAILNRPQRSALLRTRVHHAWHPIDVEIFNRAARAGLGEHDFRAFCGVLPELGGTVRLLREFEAERRGELVMVRVSGVGFLHRMVRVLVGTLVEMAQGRRDPDSLRAILDARDRRRAGYTAPAAGLYFAGVTYEDRTILVEPHLF
ncbi:tRNA pseudouridine(38-40) synthase TruA [bacterium]|nr:MAG: tRNA pseudouridine(38-40) synthase TruA [bacterium]